MHTRERYKSSFYRDLLTNLARMSLEQAIAVLSPLLLLNKATRKNFEKFPNKLEGKLERTMGYYDALIELVRTCENLFSQLNIDLYEEEQVSPAVKAACALSRADLLQTNVCIKLSYHPHAELMLDVILMLYTANLLTEENINRLLKLHDSFFRDERLLRILHHMLHIPGETLNQNIFKQIFDFCHSVPEYDDTVLPAVNSFVEQALILDAVQAPRAAELPGQRHAERLPRFNYDQITHFRSINDSSSVSAIALNNAYGAKLASVEDERTAMAEIREWLAALPKRKVTHDKPSAAQRAVARIKKDELKHKDPGSNLSIEKLLLLIWKAMHNDARRLCPQEEAKNWLLQGLYEIQRGDNLRDTEAKDDDLGPDKSICDPGAFHKLINCMEAVLPECNLDHDNIATAALAFQGHVRSEARKWVQAHAQDDAASDIVEKIKSENSAEVIWLDIRAAIHTKMKEQFTVALANDKEFAKIAGGIPYVELNLPAHNFTNSKQAALAGLESYKSNRPNTLGFFSKWFDSTRGENRANFYRDLLVNAALTWADKKIVIFAMLASKDGNTLQKQVSASLGFGTVEEAREHFRGLIKQDLDPKKFADERKRVNEKIQEIISIADADIKNPVIEEVVSKNFKRMS